MFCTSTSRQRRRASPNPSIARTVKGTLRVLLSATDVER